MKSEALEGVKRWLVENGLISPTVIVVIDGVRWCLPALSVFEEVLPQAVSDQDVHFYVFGDVTTVDGSLFSSYRNDEPARGLRDVLQRCKKLAPRFQLSDLKFLAPAIYQAVHVVQRSRHGAGAGAMETQQESKLHILLLITEGIVSDQDQVITAIRAASDHPLSIVMVSVGDVDAGELLCETLAANLPRCLFDKFQFVNFTKLMSPQHGTLDAQKVNFAWEALKKVPAQLNGAVHLRPATDRSDRAPVCVRDPPVAAPPPCLPGPPLVADCLVPAAATSAMVADIGGISPTAQQSASTDTVTKALFTCPITLGVMSDPVMAADGYTYERAAIAEWLQQHSTSPMTGLPLSNLVLLSNLALRSGIMESMRRERRTSHV